MPMRDDGSIDNGGCEYMVVVFASDALIYFPTGVLSLYFFVNTPPNTCNTKAQLELVLEAFIVTCFGYIIFLGSCVTERITAESGYFRGLTRFHWTILHAFVLFHVAVEIAILIYGSIAVLATEYAVRACLFD